VELLTHATHTPMSLKMFYLSFANNKLSIFII
jgi:hypothetical protein